WGSALDHLLSYRLADLAHDAVDAFSRQPRQRGVCAHAAGIRAFIIVVGTLVSWAGSSGTTVSPSTRQNSETSGPSKKDSSSTGLPAACTRWMCWRASARSAVTTTPLPAASPSSLTTYMGPK